MTAGEERIETDVQESDPSGNGPQGLTGDLGISSERTGPFGAAPATAGVQGTGSHGSAAEGTYGVSDTSRSDGPERDDGTAGEENPAEVPDQDFDAGKNPGHSHS
jgi:hypothetical protein